MADSDLNQDFLPEIHVGRIGILKVHQISDEELTRLVQGSGQSVFLNFGIGVISVALSFLIALLTTTIESIHIFIVFVVITILGFLVGTILLIFWWCNRQSNTTLAQEIRDRMPPRGESQQQNHVSNG
jgi:hypothetical protein